MCRLLAALLLLPSLALAQAKPGTNYAFLVSCGEKYNKAQLPTASARRIAQNVKMGNMHFG